MLGDNHLDNLTTSLLSLSQSVLVCAGLWCSCPPTRPSTHTHSLHAAHRKAFVNNYKVQRVAGGSLVMALRGVLAVVVCWCASAYHHPAAPSSPAAVPCLQFLPGVTCGCGEVGGGGGVQVSCSCQQVKTLDLRNLSQEHGITHANSFHLEDCSKTSILVFPQTFRHLTHLGSVSFHNVSRLTLEPYSISMTSRAQDGFNLSISLVTNLSIRKNAINVQLLDNPHAGINLKIRQANLISFMKSAIVGKLREFIMEEMLLKVRPWPEAVVCQGFPGAVVVMRSVMTKRGLPGRWIIGNVSALTITKSYLRLLPNAFAGVNTERTNHSKTRIVLLDNSFMTPSLPSHALPSYGFLVQANNNNILCHCKNLKWLLESPSTQVKQRLKASLACHNKTTVDTVLASCEKSCTGDDCKRNP